MSAYNLFQNMSGIWHLHRCLEDKNNPMLSGSVIGLAKFIDSPTTQHELVYVEEGEFNTLDDHTYQVWREYIYTYDTTNNKIKKYHAENKLKKELFYVLKFPESLSNSILQAYGQHQCKQDHYQSTYEFFPGVDDNKFTLTYVVNGPMKKYVSTTVFTRMM